MSIQEHLNKIRNAVYGHEVRESIAKGIETAYDDASENGNANMEVMFARGTHPNLRSRLEEVDNKQQQNTAQLQQTEQSINAQLAQKTTKGEIALQDFNKNSVQFDSTWFSDGFLEDLGNGVINTTFLEDDSVTNIKINNVSPGKLWGFETKNLINNRSTEWKDTTLIDNNGLETPSPLYKTSAPKPIEAGVTLTFDFDVRNAVIAFYKNTQLIEYKMMLPSEAPNTFTTPANTNNFRVSVSYESSPTQLVIGSKTLDNPNAFDITDSRYNLLHNADWESNKLIDPWGKTEISQHYKTSEHKPVPSGSMCEFNTDSTRPVVISFYNGVTHVEYHLVNVEDLPFKIKVPNTADTFRVSVDMTSGVNNYVGPFEGNLDSYTLKNLDIGATKEFVNKQVQSVVEQINSGKSKHDPYKIHSEIEGFIAYGQSWASGYDANAVTLEQKYKNITLNIGVKNEPLLDYTQVSSGFMPLVEKTTLSNGGGSQIVGETPISGQTNTVIQLLIEENGFDIDAMDYSLFGIAPGVGSASLVELSKGSNPYNRFVNQVQEAYTFAQAEGRFFKVLAFSWAQGAGGNGTGLSYADGLEKLRSDLETDIKLITGQTEPLKCITWQQFPRISGESKTLYEDFVGASETYDHIVCAGPAYWLQTISTANLHFKSESQVKLGAMFGIAYKRTLNDLVKYEPLKPIGVDVQGSIALIEFNTNHRLTFDTETITKAENYGFKLKDASGVDMSIEVSLAGNNTVKIKAHRGIISTDRIVYGDTGTGWGQPNGIRGNLRSEETFKYKHGEVELKINPWAVVFDKSIDELSY